QQIAPGIVATRTLWLTLYLLIPAVPVLTMRLMSREFGRRTIENLLTAPVTDGQVVAGKYIGALLFTLAMLTPLWLEVGYLAAVADLDWGRMMAGLMGVFLVICQFLAVGLLCSTLTRMQFASAILSFAVLLGLVMLWFLTGGTPSPTAYVLRYLSPLNHFRSFGNGVIDSRSLVYYVTTTALLLSVTVPVAEFKRWR
ncbi:MAG: ABC transporter permease subunit, partial [Planctomycetota bacterium]